MIKKREIMNSWREMEARGVTRLKISRISPEKLSERRAKNRVWLSSVISLMENFLSKLNRKNLYISFVDSDGVVLEVLPHNSGEKFLREGVVVKEDFFGTTAINLSIDHDAAVEVVGEEHYLDELKEWACAAAPVHNLRGSIYGVISLSSKISDYPDYALAVVSSLAEAVEKELMWRETTENLKLSKKYLDIISEGIKDGVLCLDENAKILYMNEKAADILRIDPAKAIGKFVGDVVDFTPVILSVYKTHKGYVDREFIINSPSMGTLHFIKTAVVVRDEKGKFVGVVDFFREISRVRKFVTSYIGAKAKFKFSDIVGNSKKLREAIRIAKIASKSNSNVLILGETGTGKEMFAQAIHYEGMRKRGPFVVINCGAIPRDLAESEFFGYEPGSFTGADKNGRPGKFELADGGTVFLDEIGEMPVGLQSKLLRVLQDRSVTRIGGVRAIDVDVRVIAASNRDLSSEVEKGNFRKDLYHRLNVIQIKIPPLRERREDIPLLVKHFVEKLSKKFQKRKIKIDDSFLKPLLKYDFPGNVRELENIIERALNICEGDVLDERYLPEEVLSSKIDVQSIEEVKRSALLKALKETNWNISKTAKILGVSRPTVYRLISKWNIEI